MFTRFPFHKAASPLGMLAACAAIGLTQSVFAIVVPTVKAGYDLQATRDGTKLGGDAYIGVPLGNFDFGSGAQSVGDADTIIHRLANSSVGSAPNTSAPVNAQIDALQLETPVPTNVGGAGLDNYFVTLQSVRGGTASTGQITISFTTGNSGVFDSSFDIFYDIRKGSLTGMIVDMGESIVSNTATPWQNTPPDVNDVLINGVNSNLNGNDHGQDFWASSDYIRGGAAFVDQVGNAVNAPEPGSLMLIAVTMTGLTRRTRKTK